jgi:hypothetical protein
LLVVEGDAVSLSENRPAASRQGFAGINKAFFYVDKVNTVGL